MGISCWGCARSRFQVCGSPGSIEDVEPEEGAEGFVVLRCIHRSAAVACNTIHLGFDLPNPCRQKNIADGAVSG